MQVELRNVKVNKRWSEETACFSATIYIDGKKVGECDNRGHGGDNNYHWVDPTAEQRIEEFVKTLPARNCFGMMIQPCMDTYIDDLMHDAEERKICKTKTAFTKLNKPGQLFTINEKYSPDLKKYIIEKYGEDVTILNEKYLVKS